MIRELRNVRAKRDIKIEDYLTANKAQYLDSGASKATYCIGNTVYKIPIGISTLLEEDDTYFGNRVNFLVDTEDELWEAMEEVKDYDDRLCWSVGQFSMEVMVWEKLLELEKEGYDISHFARITDYYEDCKGFFVIEQEKVENVGEASSSEIEEEFFESGVTAEVVRQLKERWGIRLYDITGYNCGVVNGKIVCFDFGYSNSFSEYDTFEDSMYCGCEEEEEDY